jgi:hypothetical protein
MPYSKRACTLVLFIFVIFTSCSYSKKVEKIVFSHYGEMPVLKTNAVPANVKVETELTNGSHQHIMSVTERKKVKMLFLLLYWHEHYMLETKLNQKIPVNQFTNSLNQSAKNSKIAEKLKDGILTLKIEQLPRTYSLHDDARAVLLMVEWSKVYLAPSGEDVVVSYSFAKEGQPLKTGKVEIKDPNKLYGLGYFQSLKAATHDYLTAYDNFYKNAGKMVLDKITAEL